MDRRAAQRRRVGVAMAVAVVWALVWACAPEVEVEVEVEVEAPAPERGEATQEGPGVKALFEAPERAERPAVLRATADGRAVFGWLSAGGAGEEVEVRGADGALRARVRAGADGTFVWPYSGQAPEAVSLRAGGLETRVWLPAPEAEAASVFFVVDRNVYRPGHALHFVGWLKEGDGAGGFRPLAAREVEAVLTSKTQRVEAARLTLTSDAHGRVQGTYRFSPEDALDTYTLALEGFEGEAEVTLAEFRKSKVKLELDAEVQAQALEVRVRAVDFVGEPVKAERVRVSAQVVREAWPSSAGEGVEGLEAGAFVYADAEASGPASALAEAFAAAGSPAAALVGDDLGGASGVPVAELQRDAEVGDDGSARLTLELAPSWLEQPHAVRLSAVVLDANGREQRAARAVALDGARGAEALDVALDRALVAVGQPVKVRARWARGPAPDAATDWVASLVRVDVDEAWLHGWAEASAGPRLEQLLNPRASGYMPNVAARALPPRFYASNYVNSFGSNGIYFEPRWGMGGARYGERWGAVPSVRATLVSATSLGADGEGEVRADRPGVYEVVVVAPDGDGKLQRRSQRLVVREARRGPGLVLEVEPEARRRAGDVVRAWVHSRTIGGRALVTLRDSVGVRAHEVVRLEQALTPVALRLPEEVRYGATLTVEAVERDGLLIQDTRLLFAEPRQRMRVTMAHEDTYAPGDEVVLDIATGRARASDLVVSVYDQSLLGVAPDAGRDATSYYLADARAHRQAGVLALRRALGGVTMADVSDLAREALGAMDEAARGGPSGQRLRRWGALSDASRSLDLDMLAEALALLGIAADVQSPYHRHWSVIPSAGRAGATLRDVTLAELIEAPAEEVRLEVRALGSGFVLTPTPKDAAAFAQRYGDGRRWQGDRQMRARADAMRSADLHVTGNAMASAQAFISHAPQAELLESGAQGGALVRRDFSDLAYWSRLARTDAQGRAQLRFKLPDSLTNWRVVVTALSDDMHVGTATSRLTTFKPVMVWPMLPRAFVRGDAVKLFASVHNRTDAPQTLKVSIAVDHGAIEGPNPATITLPPRSDAPVFWTFKPDAEGFVEVLMRAEGAGDQDASLKRLPVVAPEAAQRWDAAGFVAPDVELVIPDAVLADPARVDVTLTIAPSMLADMVATLDYLVEYPYGCVEQTMSRFLPAIKVAQTLKQAGLRRPKLEERLPGVVAQGVKRLIQLQQADGGWGWYAQGQTHEMMTPYALYGLLQAEQAGYRIGHKEAIGRGLERLRGFIQAMGEAQSADRLYSMYVYSHRRPMEASWWAFIEQLERKDALSDYALALALELAVTHKRPALARALARRLELRVKRDGSGAHWTTAGFQRWGDDRFEITAAALQALVRYDAAHALIPEVLSFFAATKRGDRWNSTKDTAMIVMAMSTLAQAQKRRPQAGAAAALAQPVTVEVNGGAWSGQVRVRGDASAEVAIPAAALRAGRNALRFGAAPSGARFTLQARYVAEGAGVKPLDEGLHVERVLMLLSAKGEPVRQLRSGDTVPRGSYLRSEVRVHATDPTYAGARELRYMLVRDPKASSFAVLPQDDPRFGVHSRGGWLLREDRTAEVAYHYEQAPSATRSVSVVLAEYGGAYVLPPAEAELMYDTAVRGQSAGFTLHVAGGEQAP